MCGSVGKATQNKKLTLKHRDLYGGWRGGDGKMHLTGWRVEKVKRRIGVEEV